DPRLHQLLDLVELLPRVDGPDVGVLVEWIANSEGLEAVLQLVEDRLEHRFLDEQPRSRAAHVALVEVDAVDDAFDGLVEGRVLEHDVGGLPPELEGQPLAASGDGAADQLPYLRRAGEGDLGD